MSSIMKGLVDEQDIEETKKLSAQEKFKRSMKRAGYDMDAGAKRLQDLLDKQKKEREEFEKKETKDVSEDATLQFAAEITPTVNPHAGIKDRKFRGAIGEGLAKSDTTYIILTESCYGLDHSQRVIVEGIYNEFKPVIEATLNANQINQLFTNIEQGATAAGGNRTMIGKGIDVGKAVNQAIDNVGKWLQDTRPVQAFDQKYENLKTKISAKFPGLEKNLTAMGTWAKENPGKTAAIIGVLTTIAALSGGPAGGAIAGQILRGTTELLKGEKISTAVGKGVKTAAIGALAGYGIDKIGDMLSGGVRMVADNLFPGARKLNLTFKAYGTGPSTFQNIPNVVGRAEDLAPIQGAWNSAATAWKNGDYFKAETLFQQAKDAAAKLSDPVFVAQITKDQASRSAIMSGAKGIMLASDAFAAAAQGAASGAGQGGLKKQTTESKRLTEREVRVLFEGVMSWLGKKATNLTTKVTADKLMMAWKKAGSPTDSNQIIPILTQNGVSQDVINAAFNQLKIPVNAPMSKPQAQPSQQTTTQTVQPKANGAPQKPVLPAQQPLINPELQKRLAARKAGKPVYSGGLEEDLRKWFKEKWVRFGPDGKIRGACARGDDSEGKPKCLPQAKAHALGKKGRKYAAAKKRREDPNPERSGPAKNVATKKKSKSESINEGLWDWIKDKLSNNKLKWNENYYNFIIRQDPLYLPTYLNAVKNDPNYIEWKKNNPNAAQQSTSKTNYTGSQSQANYSGSQSQANYSGSQNRPNQSASKDDYTAPHGSPENEYRLFMLGRKPAAIIPQTSKHIWQQALDSGRYWTKQLFQNNEPTGIVITHKYDKERGEQIYTLVQTASRLADQGDFRAYQNSNYHRRLGKLLGYPKDAVEKWIVDYFKDKVDLAKTKIDEQDLNETFDQPYKLKWYPGDMDEVTAYAEIPNGDDLSIMFNLDANEEGEEAWAVEFYRNDSQEVTGEGDAQRIFATVLSAIKTFIKKYKPNRITFSASKEVEQGQKIQSRANLYDRLVQRYASTLGYKAFRADTGDKVIYELSKIAKQVEEGSENLSYIGNCTDDDVIEYIFGDATNFAQAVEEHGNEFTIDDLVVKYDPKSDVHSFYYKKKGVAEGSDAEAYKEKLLATLPQMMRFYEKNVQGWKPSKEQMLAAIETSYTVMKHTGDVKQAGRAMMDELNTLHRMSKGQQGVAEGYTGRETKDGTWRVFKDGKAVAVAGPFKSREEAAAWIKKQKTDVAEGSQDNRQWSNKDNEQFRRAVKDIEDNFGPNDAWTKTKQRQIKQQIKTKPMSGPKGKLPEQGVAEGSDYDREPLYHATLKAFEPSITRSGLMPGGDLRMFDWSDKNYVYLSNYPDIARDFVDPGVIEPSEDHEKQILKLMKQGGVILKIDQNKLDRKLLSVDPHFQRDEDTGVETYVYSGMISPNAIIGKEYFPININESMQGVGEGFSDISGLLSASNLNKSFIITAELAEGGKKKFRVKAQNERVAIEKFKKHHSMAKIINVAEEGVEEGSKYPRNPASYHLKKYPVPQDQLARPVKKEPKKPEKKPDEKLDELKCWPGYSRVKGVPAGAPGSCKKKTKEDYQQCPECGGAMYEVSLMNEKKDACYYKVKSRYKVWPSAYASGALVKCRKKGASNWGNKSKSNEGQIYSTGGGAGQSQRYYTPKDNLGESNIMAGILGQKNEK